jgi:hypothetical protein
MHQIFMCVLRVIDEHIDLSILYTQAGMDAFECLANHGGAPRKRGSQHLPNASNKTQLMCNTNFENLGPTQVFKSQRSKAHKTGSLIFRAHKTFGKMKVSVLAAAAAVSLVRHGECGSIRGSNSFIKRQSGSSVRKLHVEDFSPLDCNEDLDTAPCQPWTERFGTEATKSERVVIECGECVEMDFSEPELTLVNGIDIQGKLIFRNGYELTLQTPMIAVQGVLQMTSTKPIDGVTSVRFIMTGETDNSFVPIDNNEENCMGGPCQVGKKAIVVAGGRVRGKPTRCERPTLLSARMTAHIST